MCHSVMASCVHFPLMITKKIDGASKLHFSVAAGSYSYLTLNKSNQNEICFPKSLLWMEKLVFSFTWWKLKQVMNILNEWTRVNEFDDRASPSEEYQEIEPAVRRLLEFCDKYIGKLLCWCHCFNRADGTNVPSGMPPWRLISSTTLQLVDQVHNLWREWFVPRNVFVLKIWLQSSFPIPEFMQSISLKQYFGGTDFQDTFRSSWVWSVEYRGANFGLDIWYPPMGCVWVEDVGSRVILTPSVQSVWKMR